MIRPIMCAIEASLLTNQPVAWRELNLGLAHNLITDEGLTAMIHSLGRCPQLVQLTLDLTDNNNIRDPEKLDTLACVLGHIPALHIKLDACGRQERKKLQRTSDDTIPMPNVQIFSLSVMGHHIFPHALRIPHRLVHLCLNIPKLEGDERTGFCPLGQALVATAATLQILRLGIAHTNLMDSPFVYFCSVGLKPLIHLRRLALDVEGNRLTNIGVDALQHVLSPTIQELKWNIGNNMVQPGLGKFSKWHFLFFMLKCFMSVNLEKMGNYFPKFSSLEKMCPILGPTCASAHRTGSTQGDLGDGRHICGPFAAPGTGCVPHAGFSAASTTQKRFSCSDVYFRHGLCTATEIAIVS